ncbi:platelet glycoprotein 4-like [Portunus trituberculatus]|nr:platelet glycoprotein 4-like [Portunus trituberculatus]
MGAPAFVSFPHFLHADPSLLDAFEGVSPPDPDKHSFVLDMIPEVGIPIKVMARMQINMLVRPYEKIKILKNVKEAYLPLLWFEEEAVIPDYMARQLQVLLVIMNTPTVYIVLGVILVLGVIGATLVTTRHYKKAKRDRERASKS